MEEDFPSMLIGENTLAAIDVVETKEKTKTVNVPNPEGQSTSGYDSNGCKSNPKNVSLNNILSKNYVKYRSSGNHANLNLKQSEKDKNVSFYSMHTCHSSKLSTQNNDTASENCSNISETKKLPCERVRQKLPEVQIFNLHDCGLPSEILKKYDEIGIKSMFQWQYECLSNESVISGKNLIYSAPTSAGKTLVAEILTIKSIFERKKKAVIILPFVSVVKEKTNYFQELMEGTGVRVEGFMGGYSPSGGFQSTDVAVCTIEKANSLINRLMEEGNLDVLGIVVVDELHLLGDTHRGYLLELLLTKIRYMCFWKNINIQIVGMSATLPNLELLSSWLQAELYKTDFRPVPLRELIKLGKTIYDKNLKEVQKIHYCLPVKGDTDDVILLCLETISQGFSVLIFCPTKNWCERLAECIAKDFFIIGTASALVTKAEKELVEKFVYELNKSNLSEVQDKLKRSPVGLDPILAKTVLLGVAFHHAGLTMDERDILESSFRSGALRVLVATSTLSSGVNLPARRVIVRTPVFHGKLVDILTYKQMIGRAGRMGVDTAGESILVCHEKERNMIERLLKSDLPPIQSCLGSGRSSKVSPSLKRAVFEVVASGVASTPEDLEIYLNLTLLAASMKLENPMDFQFKDPIKACVKFLEESEFIRLEGMGEDGVMKYVPTHLGEACLAASLPPDQALSLFEELQRARKCFVLEDELHIIYQVTPFSVADLWGDSMDWLHMLNMWESLPASMQRVGELVGIEERFIVRAMRGTLNLRIQKQMEKMGIHRRFYTALALRELVNEVPLNDVARKYGCSRGMLQNLQQSAAVFAGMVTQFCRRLRWSGMESLVSQLQDRLQFGIRGELCNLMHLPMLDGQCARALYDAGIETVAMLAADTSPVKVDQALRAFLPFQSEKTKQEEPNGRAVAKKWISSLSSVRNLLGRDAAICLIKEARRMVQKELGVADMKWKDFGEIDQDSSSYDLGTSPGKLVCLSEVAKESNSIVVKSPVLRFENEKVKDPDDPREFVAPSDVEKVSSSKKTSSVDELVRENRCMSGSRSHVSKTNMESSSHNLCDSSVTSEHKCDSEDNRNGPEDRASVAAHVMHENAKNKSFSSSKGMPTLCASSSPITSILANSSDLDRTKRTSLDIFSSPLADEIPAASITNRSPSLFGDSFTVDTQLENLLHGSADSNKVHLTSLPPDRILESDSCVNSHSSTPKLLVGNPKVSVDSFSPVCCKPSGTLKPFPTVNRLDFNQFSPVQNAPPQIHMSIHAKEGESVDIHAIAENVTLSKWDFGSNIEEDIFDESICDMDYTKHGSKTINQEVNLEVSSKESSKFVSVPTRNKSPFAKCNEDGAITSSECSYESMFKVERENFDKITECHEDSNENHLNQCKKDVPVVAHSKDGSSFIRNEKRLSFDAVSNSFLEKAFTTAFDFDDNMTVRLEGASNDILEKDVLPPKGEIIAESNELTCVDVEESGKKEVWGSHMQNCSMEAVHHNIMYPSSSEEDDTVIFSSQAFSVSKIKDITSLRERFGHMTKVTQDDLCMKSEGQQDKSNANGASLLNLSNVIPYKSSTIPNNECQVIKVPETQAELSDEDDLNSSLVPSFNIVDVCKDVHIFKDFCNKFKSQKRFSFSVAVSQSEDFYDSAADYESQKVDGINNVHIDEKKEKYCRKRKRPDAGSEHSPSYSSGIRSLLDDNSVVAGIAFAWEGKRDNVFFMSFDSSKNCVGDKITPSHYDKITFLKKTFEPTEVKKRTSIAMHLKDHLRTLFVAYGIEPFCSNHFWDPKVANWLLNPDGKEMNLRSLCMTYCPRIWKLIEECGFSSACKGCWSMGLDAKSSLPPHLRSSIEALVALKSMSALEDLLQEQNLLSVFSGVEMPAVCCLVQIEAFGIGFCKSQGLHMKSVFASEMRKLEKKAYSIAGHPFRMSFPKEVGKVLYQELRLPWRDPKISSNFKVKKKWSTSKETLERLASDHQLPQIVIEWRKMSAILSMTILPLIKSCQWNRIRGTHIIHTSTGRIYMFEPNLQHIPRDFEISSLMPDKEHDSLKKDGNREADGLPKEGNILSIRQCFIPREGFMYLSADYSQLELRLIAHMSKDKKLCSILNNGCDVFCLIASAWKKIDAENVTSKLRQQAKNICYGMLYGIGSKALAEQLGVDENEASNFIETFKNSFPGLKAFLISAVQKCRAEGFVTTMSGRRRQIPAIKSSNRALRAQAERQAINTLIQGSAADLVKSAMVQINEKLHLKFPSFGHPMYKRHLSPNLSLKRPRINGSNDINNVASHISPEAILVLHLHDELIYEVSADALESVVPIVKSEMEGIWKLSVELPVNMKVGTSWGSLHKYETNPLK